MSPTPSACGQGTAWHVASRRASAGWGGKVFDGSSVVGDVLGSPLFTPAPFDTGTTQYVDAMRRAEFWDELRESDYHLLLDPELRPVETVTVPTGVGQAGTTVFGAPAARVSGPWLNAVTERLASTRSIDPQSLVVFLTRDVLLFDAAGCCRGGFHGVVTGSYEGNGAQPVTTYLVASWYTPGGFRFSDTTVLSHELAEWADDPFGTNRVDPWISPLPLARSAYGCYGFLEVGDPTIDVEFSVDGIHHLQDSTFFSWFAREAPSGIDGRYTYTGAITNPASRCMNPA